MRLKSRLALLTGLGAVMGMAGCGPEPVTRTVTTEQTTTSVPPPPQVVTTTTEVKAPVPHYRPQRTVRAYRQPVRTEDVVEETTETRTLPAPTIQRTTRSTTESIQPR